MTDDARTTRFRVHDVGRRSSRDDRPTSPKPSVADATSPERSASEARSSRFDKIPEFARRLKVVRVEASPSDGVLTVEMVPSTYSSHGPDGPNPPPSTFVRTVVPWSRPGSIDVGGEGTFSLELDDPDSETTSESSRSRDEELDAGAGESLVGVADLVPVVELAERATVDAGEDGALEAIAALHRVRTCLEGLPLARFVAVVDSPEVTEVVGPPLATEQVEAVCRLARDRVASEPDTVSPFERDAIWAVESSVRRRGRSRRFDDEDPVARAIRRDVATVLRSMTPGRATEVENACERLASFCRQGSDDPGLDSAPDQTDVRSSRRPRPRGVP